MAPPLVSAKVSRLLAAHLELMQTLSSLVGVAASGADFRTPTLIHRRGPLVVENRLLLQELLVTY